jgi:ferredoxin
VICAVEREGKSLSDKTNNYRRLTMKVRVDQDACVGDETCVAICPEIFEMDGEVATTKMEDVPKDAQDSCREAADACPVEAIIIEE